jgi:hypothetical protein
MLRRNYRSLRRLKRKKTSSYAAHFGCDLDLAHVNTTVDQVGLGYVAAIDAATNHWRSFSPRAGVVRRVDLVAGFDRVVRLVCHSGKMMRTLTLKITLFSVFVMFAGCEQLPTASDYVALPAPAPEHPVVNPAYPIRQQNWLGGPGRNEGSCVHASLSSMLHWQNQFTLAQRWRKTYDGGEYDSRLRDRLKDAGIPYAYTVKTNIEFLDFAHNTRRGALMWWKPNHCCTFCGWVRGNDQKIYAVILDNNSTQKYELVERNQLHRLWAGYGGFALTTLYDPPSPPIYKSYSLRPNF